MSKQSRKPQYLNNINEEDLKTVEEANELWDSSASCKSTPSASVETRGIPRKPRYLNKINQEGLFLKNHDEDSCRLALTANKSHWETYAAETLKLFEDKDFKLFRFSDCKTIDFEEVLQSWRKETNTVADFEPLSLAVSENGRLRDEAS